MARACSSRAIATPGDRASPSTTPRVQVAWPSQASPARSARASQGDRCVRGRSAFDEGSFQHPDLPDRRRTPRPLERLAPRQDLGTRGLRRERSLAAPVLPANTPSRSSRRVATRSRRNRGAHRGLRQRRARPDCPPRARPPPAAQERDTRAGRMRPSDALRGGTRARFASSRWSEGTRVAPADLLHGGRLSAASGRGAGS